MLTTGAKISLVVTALLLLLVSAVSAFIGFMAWGLALNGFMGNETAVNASMITYVVLAIGTAIFFIALGVFIVYRLTARRSWNAAAAASLSVVIFSVVIVAVHLVSVIISTMVASALRN